MKCELVRHTMKRKGITKIEYNALTFTITYPKTSYFCLLEQPHYQIHRRCRKIKQTS